MVSLDAVTRRPVSASARRAQARATNRAVRGETRHLRHNCRPRMHASSAAVPASHLVRDCHTRAGCRPSRAQERPRWPRSWFSLSASSIRLRITAPRSGSSVVSRSVGAPCDAPSFGMLDTAFGCALPSEQLGKLVRLSGLAPKPGLRAANSSRFTRSRSPFGFGPGGRSLFCVGALCGCQRRWLSPVRLLSLEVSGGQPVRPRRSSALGASASRRLYSARP